MRHRCDHLSPRTGEVNFCVRLLTQGGQSKASPLSDIGRALASVGLGLADATLAAAANEGTGKWFGPRVGSRQIIFGPHRFGKGRLGLKRADGLASRPSGGCETHDQDQEAEAAKHRVQHPNLQAYHPLHACSESQGEAWVKSWSEVDAPPRGTRITTTPWLVATLCVSATRKPLKWDLRNSLGIDTRAGGAVDPKLVFN
jgi:hypothetical protein